MGVDYQSDDLLAAECRALSPPLYADAARWAISAEASRYAHVAELRDAPYALPARPSPYPTQHWALLDAEPVEDGPVVPKLYRLHAFNIPGGMLRLWQSSFAHFYRAELTVAPGITTNPTQEIVVPLDYSPAQDQVTHDTPPDAAEATYQMYLDYDIRQARLARYAAMGFLLRESGHVMPLWRPKNNTLAPHVELGGLDRDSSMGDFRSFDYVLATEYLAPLGESYAYDNGIDWVHYGTSAYSPLPPMGWTRITQIGANLLNHGFCNAIQPYVIPDVLAHPNVIFDEARNFHTIAWTEFSYAFAEEDDDIEVTQMFAAEGILATFPRPRTAQGSLEAVFGPVYPPGSAIISMCDPIYCSPVCNMCESRYFPTHLAALALQIKSSWHDYTRGAIMRPYSPFRCHARIEISPGVFSAQCRRPLTNDQLFGRPREDGRKFTRYPTLFCDACASYYHWATCGYNLWEDDSFPYTLVTYLESGRAAHRADMRTCPEKDDLGMCRDCTCSACTWPGPPTPLPLRTSNKDYTTDYVDDY